ncbi:hypothetical protein [Propionicimonas paludicola]|uniref:hypothetical protein n=1 Tax=Propionicimonas paludicola TaxID=185243 RepID=UPI00117A3FBD|nr:hypothetical protein [Propionicimonas paludicola]
MANDDSSTPRRALGPIPDDWADSPQSPDSPAGHHYEPPSPLTDTGLMRRLAAFRDDEPAKLTTPVPPPRPVLPDPEGALPPAHGRRFSANDIPYGEWAAPRRSAASPLSPIPDFNPVLPPPNRPTAPPSVTVPLSGVTGSPQSALGAPAAPVGPTSFDKFPKSIDTAPTPPRAAEPELSPRQARRAEAARLKAERAEAKRAADEQHKAEQAAAKQAAAEAKAARKESRGHKVSPEELAATAAARLAPPTSPSSPVRSTATGSEQPEQPQRKSRPVVIIVASVTIVVLLVISAIYLLSLRSAAPSGTNSPAQAPIDPLLTSTELGTLGGQSWGTQEAANAARPLCLPATADGLPAAQRTSARRIVSTTSATDSLLQIVDVYPDVTSASTAYALRLQQTGICADDVAVINGASTIDGMTDSANAVMLTVQDAKPIYHTLLLSRTGRTVSLIDLATSTQLPVTAVATVASNSVTRQCSSGDGTCPSGIQVKTSLPPAGNQPGWLVAADLPRITPGSGRWSSTDNPVNSLGSGCEGVDLTRLSGANADTQRTLLLADDPKAPSGFGVDQVTYTYADAKAATAAAKTINTNIASCAERTLTATVDSGPKVSGTGANSLKFSGSTFHVTQKTGQSTPLYRVGVVTVGKRLVYLLANPTKDFDFSDESWKAVVQRAAERVTQLP